MALYAAFEDILLPDPRSTDPVKPRMMNCTRYVLTSDRNQKKIWGNPNWKRIKAISEIVKQIPSTLRSYDDVTDIWTIPRDKFEDVVRKLVDDSFCPMLVFGQSLDDFALNKPLNSNTSSNSWADAARKQASFKAEATEDFFKNAAPAQTLMPLEDVRTQLMQLIKPHVPATLELKDKESFLRGYKLAARKLHPDFNGGDSSKMTQLNYLFQQYKELV